MEKVIEPMTSGSIGKRMMFFALPLLLGNLFQQLYNTVDSLIVGNFLGSSALAAVSSSGSLIFMLIGFLSGISAGAGVVISQYFGAEDVPNIQRAVHTTVAFGIAAGLLMTIVGILQAVGDSRHPLYYLMASSVINLVLDILFIGFFHTGVGGAALATVISQVFSAILCFVQLLRTKESYQLRLSSIRFDLLMLGRIIRIGLPSGVQNSIIAFANVVVQ